MPAARLLSPARIVALFVALSSLPITAMGGDGTDRLLTVDRHRPQIIERIVDAWGAALARSSSPLSIDDLRTRLQGLRADRLLEASLMMSLDGLRDVVESSSETKPSTVHAKALGDATIDSVYTPVTPCRLVETRGTFAAVYQGDGSASHAPLPFTTNQIRTYAVQGGNGVCLSQLPAGLHPSAVQLQVFGMPTTPTSGDIEILPQGSTFGTTATMVYVASIAFNTVSTAARINPANNQISVQVRGGGANVAIDVVGYFKGAADATAMNIQVNGQRVMRYEYNATSPNIVGGFSGNVVAAFPGQTIAGGGFAGDCAFNGVPGTRPCRNETSAGFATVGGGDSNVAQGEGSTVAGGEFNAATNFTTTVSGGTDNVASGAAATVSGGAQNTASGLRSTVSGGSGNSATSEAATISGGEGNTASRTGSTVAGGSDNTASGFFSAVIGGIGNVVIGDGGVAAGHEVQVGHPNTFVWNGWDSGSASSFRSNAFQIHGQNGLDIEYGTRRVDGGGTSWVFIGNGFPGQAIATSTGAFLSTAGVWVPASSSKSRKADFAPVDVKAVLERLVRLPITTWRYTVDEGDVRHMGPMAEDFWAAFNIGYGDRTIADLDARGVAFAAIQGLREMLQERDLQIAEQERRIEAQQRRLDVLEATVLELERTMRPDSRR